MIQAPQGTHFAFGFGSKFANHLFATKSISVFKFQKDAHFVFSSKMIQGSQGTHFTFALSQSSQIICLLPNQFECQTRDSSFRRYALYSQFLVKDTKPTNYHSKWQLQKVSHLGVTHGENPHFCNFQCYGGERRRLIFYSRAGLHWPYKVSLWLVIIKLSVILNYKMNLRYANKQIWSYKCMFTESWKLHNMSSIDMFLAQNTHSIII